MQTAVPVAVAARLIVGRSGGHVQQSACAVVLVVICIGGTNRPRRRAFDDIGVEIAGIRVGQRHLATVGNARADLLSVRTVRRSGRQRDLVQQVGEAVDIGDEVPVCVQQIGIVLQARVDQRFGPSKSVVGFQDSSAYDGVS